MMVEDRKNNLKIWFLVVFHAQKPWLINCIFSNVWPQYMYINVCTCTAVCSILSLVSIKFVFSFIFKYGNVHDNENKGTCIVLYKAYSNMTEQAKNVKIIQLQLIIHVNSKTTQWKRERENSFLLVLQLGSIKRNPHSTTNLKQTQKSERHSYIVCWALLSESSYTMYMYTRTIFLLLHATETEFMWPPLCHRSELSFKLVIKRAYVTVYCSSK